jgi:lysophospholipase L1-like esterase
MRYSAARLISWPLFFGVVACASVSTALAQESRPAVPDPARFERDIRAFAEWDRKNSAPTDAVLFVGSSSIVGWATHEAFPGWPIINRGFGGSQMSDLNHYFDQVVKPYRARAIVVYEGDNDIEGGRTPAEIREGFVAFVRKVRETQPDTPIVLLAIKPSESRWEHWPRMQEANALLRTLAEAERAVTFVDVATPLLGDDGRPRAALFKDDRLHLNAAGYEVWQKTLQPVLQRWLGKSA